MARQTPYNAVMATQRRNEREVGLYILSFLVSVLRHHWPGKVVSCHTCVHRHPDWWLQTHKVTGRVAEVTWFSEMVNNPWAASKQNTVPSFPNLHAVPGLEILVDITTMKKHFVFCVKWTYVLAFITGLLVYRCFEYLA